MPRLPAPGFAKARVRVRALAGMFDAHPHASVFGIALVLRLAAVLWLPEAPYDQGGDAPHYLSIARDLVEGRPYGSSSGDATRVPLYQAFLALHLWLFGEALWVIAVSQAVLGAATAVILTLTAAELLPGPRRWIAGLLWALYPPSILNTVVLFTQPLQVFWLSAAFWMLFAGLRRHSATRCAAASLLWGLACLTRAGNLFFLPILSLGPLLCWRLVAGTSTRWRLAVSVAMVLTGTLSVVWWTGRQFPATYRLEDLLTNPHERGTLALLLRPIEPLNARLSERLRQWSARGRATPAAVAGTPAAAPGARTTDVPSDPPVASLWADRDKGADGRPAGSSDIGRAWRRELGRAGTKLWQAFRAPDGLVQMQCAGPSEGYWAYAGTDPARAVLAVGRPCLAIKSVAYVWHYALLLCAVPGFVLLTARWPGVGLLLGLYACYTIVIIVLGSNYNNTIAAVPRFAFSLMYIPVLLTGLALCIRFERAPGGPTPAAG